MSLKTETIKELESANADIQEKLIVTEQKIEEAEQFNRRDNVVITAYQQLTV